MKKTFKNFLLVCLIPLASIHSGCKKTDEGSAPGATTPVASGTITTLTTSASGSYKEASNIDLTATFSEAVTVAGSPRIVLSVGGTAKYATYFSGTGTTILVFRYAVDSGAIDTDGILVGGVQMNNGTILNASGGLVDLSFLPPNTAGILVDTTAPSAQSATGPASATYVPGQALNFVLTFNEVVNVTGTPRLVLTIGSTTRYANYLSGTGTTVLNFRYTVQSGESDLNGIAVLSTIELNGGNISDIATNSATLNFTAPNTASVNVTECPSNFVAIAPLSPYTTSLFCAAKYEMKNVSSVATSQPTGTLWVWISQSASITACTNLGAGYDLISNAQWQTIARNIEGVSFNWATGTVGNSGGLSTGHTDGSPGSGLAAVADDNDSCAGTGQTCDLTTWSNQRRVNRLASGSYLWDFAGNLSEWVRDTNSTSFGANDFVSIITAASHPTNGSIGGVSNNAKYHFGPAGDYSALSSAPYGGLGYLYISPASTGVFRGAEITSGAMAGMFSGNLTASSSATSGSIGFRCVWIPQ